MRKIYFIIVILFIASTALGCSTDSTVALTSEEQTQSAVASVEAKEAVTVEPTPSSTSEYLEALRNMDTHVDVATPAPSEEKEKMRAYIELTFGSYFEIDSALENAPNIEEIMETRQVYLDYVAAILAIDQSEQEKADQINELIATWNQKQQEYLAAMGS